MPRSARIRLDRSGFGPKRGEDAVKNENHAAGIEGRDPG
jgi:hypothetical protein